MLITGAARGIGAEAARAIASSGARLALVGLEPELLEQVAADCGPGSIAVECDVTDGAALEGAVERTAAELGGIDVAVANAGVGVGGMVVHSDFDAVERAIAINLVGAARTLKLCLPHVLERRGYLLAVTSIAVVAHSPWLAAYSASKAGLEAFANALRTEVRHRGVGVGVVYYPWVDTEMLRAADEHPDFKHIRDSLPGPFAKTYPVSMAANAVVRGIERRKRAVVVPRWLRPLLPLRGVMQPLSDLQVRDEMEEFDRISAERAAEAGAAGTGPVGPGGRAAVRSAEVR